MKETIEMQTCIQTDKGKEYCNSIPQSAINRLAKFMLTKLQENPLPNSRAA